MKRIICPWHSFKNTKRIIMPNRRCRNSNGQGIIEGAVLLVLIVGAGVLSTAFIFNCGAAVLYKTKLSMITTQAARWACCVSDSRDLQSETQTYVQQMMTVVGIKPSSLNVTAQQVNSGGQSAVVVSVSNQFPIIFGEGSFVPAQIQVCDTECSTLPSN